MKRKRSNSNAAPSGKNVKKKKISYKPYILKSTSELKYYDSIITNYSVDTTGEIVPITTSTSGSGSTGTLVQVPQGDKDFERNGRKIVISKINYKGVLTTDGAALSGTVIQLCLVLDRQCNGALPSYTTIYETNSFNSYMNLSNSKRFKILAKERFEINPNTNITTTTTLTQTHNIEGTIKCNIPIEYDNTVSTGALSSIRSNNLFWVAISSTTDDLSGLNLTTRLRIKDN